MLQRRKSRISAAPPQSPQCFVIGVTRARARARTVQTKRRGDCGGSQGFRGFPADAALVGAVLALDIGQRTGWAVRTADGTADGAVASGAVAAYGTRAALAVPAPTVAAPDRIEWRAIPGWPDYEVSEWGDVRRRTPAHNARAGTVLAPFYRANGYAQLHLSADRRRRRFLVHRLVALAFLGPQPSPAHEVAHLNGHRGHNHHRNLRWVLHRENEDHKHRHGTRLRGSRIGTARLTEAQVRVIKDGLRAGRNQTELAARFDVHVSTVDLIARGQVWRHVP